MLQSPDGRKDLVSGLERIDIITGGFKDAAQPGMFVDHNQDRAMDKQVDGRLAFFRLFLDGRQLQRIDGQAGDLFGRAGQEHPAIEIGTEALSINFQNRRGIEFRIGREADQPGLTAGRKGRLQLTHLPGHLKAGARTACENDIGHPNFSAQVGKRNRPGILVGQREIGYLAVDR